MNGPAPATPRSALLARVGGRVRAARNTHGLSRRALSELSGISQRYLAQLENGEGNMSLALLERVARALDTPLVALVGDDEPETIAERFRHADAATQAAVLGLLPPPDDGRAARVCLVGLRGAGKSTLGQGAGAALGAPFVELNREIEAHAGMPVSEIMGLYGPDGYRALEAQTLDRVIAGHSRVILAVAGGIVADADTYDRLLARFHTIWISASAQEHMDRVRAQGDERPMAGNPQAMAQLRALLEARIPLYSRADAHLETGGRPVDASIAALTGLIRERGYLDRI